MKDNIILITTDQQRFDTIQALGNKSIFTPHLNYMASLGITFDRCYADCPLCMPSRTTIMTGVRGYQNGVVSNDGHTEYMRKCEEERKTLPLKLMDAGYQTKAVGKMHFEPARAKYGFESMILPLDYMRESDKSKKGIRPKMHGVGECEMEPVLSTVDAADSITTWTVEQSIDYIETRDPHKPFFLWTSFTKPHPPFDPCKEYFALYENITMPAPVYGDWSEDLDKAPQGFYAGAYENTNMHLFSKEQIAASRRAYYAMITHVDYSLGLLFGSLREQGLLSNTWVIFTSDHGEMLGDHHLSQKNVFFEGSAHIPMIIMPPPKYESKKNERNSYLAEIADIYPTILHIAGAKENKEVDGRNLLELKEERTFYGNSLNDNFCIMEDGYKLVYSRWGGRSLLFDMKADPMETKNLAEVETYKSIYDKLWIKLLAHVKETSPQVLSGDAWIEKKEPSFPGDVNSRWFGFHYRDYSVDTFH